MVVQGGESGVRCPNDFLLAGVLDWVEVSVTHVVFTHVLTEGISRIEADVKTVLRVFAEQREVHETGGGIEFGLDVGDMRNDVRGKSGLLQIRVWMEDYIRSLYSNFFFAELIDLVPVLHFLKQCLIAENCPGIQGDVAWIGGWRQGQTGRGGNCRQQGRTCICSVFYQRCGGGSCGRNGTCTTLEGRQEVCRNICIFEVSVVDIEKVYNVVLCRVA